MVYAAEEASWMRDFDPVSRLLFDLFREFRTYFLSRFVPLTREPSFQWTRLICAIFQWTGSTPAGF